MVLTIILVSLNVSNAKGDRKPLPGIGVLVKVENNRFVVDKTSYN
jgi:serine/threonine-protein kinase